MSAKYKSPSFLLPNELNTSTNPSLSEDRGSMYSIDFPLTNYIDLGATSNFDFNTSNFSVSLWMKEDSASGSYQPLIDLGGYAQSPYNQGTAIYTNDANKIHIYNRGSSPSNWLTSITTSGSGWNHICVVRSGDNLTVYINNSTGQVSQTFTGVSSLNFGGAATSRISGTGSWSGFIDEVCIFNKALTSSNITSLYNSGSPVSSATTINLGAVAYYPLGEQAQMQGYLGNEASSEWQFPNSVLQDYVMDFDSTSPGDAITSYTSGITGNAARTVSFWYNIGTSSSAMIPFSLGGINDTNSNSQFAYCINRQNSATKAAIFGRGGNDISPITVPATNDSQWHSVIITYTGSTLALYIDGNNITLPSQPSAYATTDGFKIGGWSEAGNRLFDGQLSNIAIWNSDQSANIANIYNNGSPQTTYTVTPQNWWKLNADSVYTPSAPNYTTALNFNSTKADLDYVQFGNTSLSLPASLSIWLKPLGVPSTGYGMPYSDSSGQIYWATGAGGMKYEVTLAGASQLNSTVTLTADIGGWQHLVITFTSAATKIYLNGELNASGSGGTGTNFGQDINIGRWKQYGTNTLYGFDGSISNFAIFNSELSASQVSTLFNFGTPETNISLSPIHNWKLNNLTTGLNDTGSLASNNGTAGSVNGTGPVQESTSVAVVPSWKIPSALTIPTINYTSALKLESSNSESVGFSSSINTSSTTTFSMWLKPTSTNKQYLLSTNNGIQGILIKNNKLYIFDFNAVQGFPQSNDLATLGLADGNWHHLAITRDNRIVNFYFDGNNINHGTPSFTADFVSFNVSDFGKTYATNQGGYYDGEVSNLAIFNSVLSLANIQTLYNNGQPQDNISFTPTHWWKLNSINGTTVTDTNGSNNGTTSGSIETTDVKTSDLNIPVNGVSTTLPSTALQQSDLQFDSPYSNYSLSFDGTGDYINCGNNVGLSEISSMAFSNWVKYDNPSQANTWRVSMGNCYWNTYGFSTGIARTGIVPSGGVQPFFTLLSSSGTTNKIGGQNSTSNATSLNPLIANTWYHVAGTWDGTTMKLFINGVIHDYKTFSSSWTLDSTTATFFIGSGASGSNSSFPTLGNVDEVALWLNKTLTDAEILQIYNNGKPNDISSLSPTNWWRLGENAYFDNNSFVVPNSISGAPNGTGFGTVTTMISADAPGTYANGIGTNLDIVDRVGDAPLSIANSQSYNMIPSNISPYVPGYVGNQIANNFSMTFDGVDDIFDLSSEVLFDSTKSFSVSAWVKLTSYSLSQYPSIAKLKTDTSTGWTFGLSNRSAYAGVFFGSSSNFVRGKTTGDISGDFIGTWKHICLVFDGVDKAALSSYKIYVDGGNIGLAAAGSFSTVSNTSSFIGGQPGNKFNGQIDEVAIFDTALNAGQIYNDIYQPTATGTNQTADLVNNPNLPTPVAWYRMGD